MTTLDIKLLILIKRYIYNLHCRIIASLLLHQIAINNKSLPPSCHLSYIHKRSEHFFMREPARHIWSVPLQTGLYCSVGFGRGLPLLLSLWFLSLCDWSFHWAHMIHVMSRQQCFFTWILHQLLIFIGQAALRSSKLNIVVELRESEY